MILICVSVHEHPVRLSPVCPRPGRIHRPGRPQRQDKDRQRSGPCVRPLQTRPRHRELPLLPVSGGRVSITQPLHINVRTLCPFIVAGLGPVCLWFEPEPTSVGPNYQVNSTSFTRLLSAAVVSSLTSSSAPLSMSI